MEWEGSSMGNGKDQGWETGRIKHGKSEGSIMENGNRNQKVQNYLPLKRAEVEKKVRWAGYE